MFAIFTAPLEAHNISLLKELTSVWATLAINISLLAERNPDGRSAPTPAERTETSQLHAIAKTITNRQNLCPQLGMVDEVLIKFAQRLRRRLLIRRTNLTRYLTAPKKVVA